MSLYNMLFGENVNSEIILAILGLKKSDIERYRDCSLEDEEITIYTRTGGGNREDYPNIGLIENPYYLGDEDDEGDSTYALYHFSIPKEIKEDVANLKDIKKNGISGKLISWILRTIQRKPTENDLQVELWNQQIKLVVQSKQTSIVETNGHTIVPLDEASLEIYLSLMEKAGGKQLSFSVLPYKIKVEENVFKWKFENDRLPIERDFSRVKLSFPEKWEIDQVLWNRWEEKYKSKYPKAINTISDWIKEQK
jgi:hypothetical protein